MGRVKARQLQPLREAPPTELEGILSDLILANGRLVRMAAYAIGNAESPATWRTLSVLASAGPLRLGELAVRSRVSQPTMTKIVSSLTEQGHVTRVPDATDARAWVIAITSQGGEALTAWCRELGRALAPHFTDARPEEIDALRIAVRLIKDRVENDGRGAATSQARAHQTTRGNERYAE